MSMQYGTVWYYSMVRITLLSLLLLVVVVVVVVYDIRSLQVTDRNCLGNSWKIRARRPAPYYKGGQEMQSSRESRSKILRVNTINHSHQTDQQKLVNLNE